MAKCHPLPVDREPSDAPLAVMMGPDQDFAAATEVLDWQDLEVLDRFRVLLNRAIDD